MILSNLDLIWYSSWFTGKNGSLVRLLIRTVILSRFAKMLHSLTLQITVAVVENKLSLKSSRFSTLSIKSRISISKRFCTTNSTSNVYTLYRNFFDADLQVDGGRQPTTVRIVNVDSNVRSVILTIVSRLLVSRILLFQFDDFLFCFSLEIGTFISSEFYRLYNAEESTNDVQYFRPKC